MVAAVVAAVVEAAAAAAAEGSAAEDRPGPLLLLLLLPRSPGPLLLLLPSGEKRVYFQSEKIKFVLYFLNQLESLRFFGEMEAAILAVVSGAEVVLWMGVPGGRKKKRWRVLVGVMGVLLLEGLGGGDGKKWMGVLLLVGLGGGGSQQMGVLVGPGGSQQMGVLLLVGLGGKK